MPKLRGGLHRRSKGKLAREQQEAVMMPAMQSADWGAAAARGLMTVAIIGAAREAQ
jgi:hypothetical protein